MSTLNRRQMEKRQRLASQTAGPRPPAGKPAVAITEVTALAVGEPVSGRGQVLLSVETDAGVTGIGECAPQPDTASALQRVRGLRGKLLGQDALAAEALRHRLLGEAGAGGILPALGMALLDILGKLARAPAHEVLGGPTRERARALAHLHGNSGEALRDSLRRAHGSGHRAFLVPLPFTDGEIRHPTFPRRVLEMLDRLRQEVGEEADFVVDGGGRLEPAVAVGLARELERFHILWLEEPCRPATAASIRKITEETVVPVGIGRGVRQNREFQELLRHDAVDILRPDTAHLGIQEIRRAAALAETSYVAVAPFHRGGPVATAAALQAAASIPNFFIQEVPLPDDERDVAMRRSLTVTPVEEVRDGFLSLPAGPGLGVELNSDSVERYRVRN